MKLDMKKNGKVFVRSIVETCQSLSVRLLFVLNLETVVILLFRSVFVVVCRLYPPLNLQSVPDVVVIAYLTVVDALRSQPLL